jgi:hypothetical protein
MTLASATPPASPSGARLTGDDTQHAIAWYYALLALHPRSNITSISVEALQAGNVDDVVVRHAAPPDDYMQVKATVSAKEPATIAWLTNPTAAGGPSILQRFHDFYTAVSATGALPRLQLITSRSIDPADPLLTLRDRNDCVADRLRRGSTRAVLSARRTVAAHLGLSEDRLCAFLDGVRVRTDASEATWTELVAHLSLALGLDDSDRAIRLGVSEVRGWVKTSRAAKTPADIAAAVDRLGLRVAEPWDSLVVQALETETETGDAAVVLDWVEYFIGDEGRARRGLKDPAGWNTILRPELAAAERTLSSSRVLVRGQARLPVWFAVGTHLGRTRGYRVGKLQNGDLWSSDTQPAALPLLDRSTLRAPVAGGPVALSVAVSADPCGDAARYLALNVPLAGHLRLALRTGVGSHAIIGADHAWATALALRDEARQIASQLRPSVIHLFLAAPSGLALLLGHVWDRVPDTQTYEDLAANGYQPAFFIPN